MLWHADENFYVLQAFNKRLTPFQTEVSALNQKGTTLSENCRPEDSDLVTSQLEEVNNRWDDLCVHSSDRQHKIEEALLQLGQFQLALDELLVWIKQTNVSLDEQLARNVRGDVKFIEVEKAKHKVSGALARIGREYNLLKLLLKSRRHCICQLFKTELKE